MGGAGVERRGPGFVIYTTVWAVERRLPSGGRDHSFAINGLLRLRGSVFGDATDLAVEGDNRVLVSTGSTDDTRAHPLTVVRLTARGALDRRFGDGGVASVTFPSRTATPEHVALAPDGEIV
ncbi:MAG: hypothetical protein M3Q23_06410 [Actinomycetota bacterium]|nr:hypothetical protein [Actinomycetota bacterium]